MDASGRNASRRDKKIPARVWNTLVRSAEQVRRESYDQQSEITLRERASNIILVKNTTGITVPRYGALAFSGVVQNNPRTSSASESSFCNAPILTGIKPTGEDTAWGVALDPIADGAIGRVAVGGAVPAKINVHENDHGFARPVKDDVEKLESSKSEGAVILWKEPTGGTSPQWCLIRFGGGGSKMHIVRTDGDWAVGSCRTVYIVDPQAPCGNLADNGQGPGFGEPLEEVNNFLYPIADGAHVMVAQSADGFWYAVGPGDPQGYCQRTAIGGEDLTKRPNYKQGSPQVLGHDGTGCIAWYDTQECPPPDPPSPGGG
jgi:hypothetical protein